MTSFNRQRERFLSHAAQRISDLKGEIENARLRRDSGELPIGAVDAENEVIEESSIRHFPWVSFQSSAGYLPTFLSISRMRSSATRLQI